MSNGASRGGLLRRIRNVVAGESISHVQYECRRCGKSMDNPLEECPDCGASDVAKYEF